MDKDRVIIAKDGTERILIAEEEESTIGESASTPKTEAEKALLLKYMNGKIGYDAFMKQMKELREGK